MSEFRGFACCSMFWYLLAYFLLRCKLPVLLFAFFWIIIDGSVKNTQIFFVTYCSSNFFVNFFFNLEVLTWYYYIAARYSVTVLVLLVIISSYYQSITVWQLCDQIFPILYYSKFHLTYRNTIIMFILWVNVFISS